MARFYLAQIFRNPENVLLNRSVGIDKDPDGYWGVTFPNSKTLEYSLEGLAYYRCTPLITKKVL